MLNFGWNSENEKIHEIRKLFLFLQPKFYPKFGIHPKECRFRQKFRRSQLNFSYSLTQPEIPSPERKETQFEIFLFDCTPSLCVCVCLCIVVNLCVS